MNKHEMMRVRGGRWVHGPDKISESDLELPDLAYSGPDKIHESDLDLPDKTRSYSIGSMLGLIKG